MYDKVIEYLIRCPNGFIKTSDGKSCEPIDVVRSLPLNCVRVLTIAAIVTEVKRVLQLITIQ